VSNRRDQPTVETLYRSGVQAIQEITDSFSLTDWDRTVCGEWDASDTARHLLGVIDWYHESAPTTNSVISQPNQVNCSSRRAELWLQRRVEFVELR